MGHIPADASLWDSGDWIEWHRNSARASDLPIATIRDQSAHLTRLQVSLLCASKGYFELTGDHLNIYDQISRVHAALKFGIPLSADAPLELTGVHLLTLSPPENKSSVEVDLGLPFTSVLVVRIDQNFVIEGRMITRRTMGERSSGTRLLKWRNLPKGR